MSLNQMIYAEIKILNRGGNNFSISHISWRKKKKVNQIHMRRRRTIDYIVFLL